MNYNDAAIIPSLEQLGLFGSVIEILCIILGTSILISMILVYLICFTTFLFAIIIPVLSIIFFHKNSIDLWKSFVPIYNIYLLIKLYKSRKNRKSKC